MFRKIGPIAVCLFVLWGYCSSSCFAQNPTDTDSKTAKSQKQTKKSTAQASVGGCRPATAPKPPKNIPKDQIVPLSVADCVPEQLALSDPQDPQKHLSQWTNWSEENDFGYYSLHPKGSFSGFGDLDPDGTKPLQNNLYVIQMIDSEQSEKGKISVLRSTWYIYRYKNGTFVSLIKSSNELPTIFGATNGYIVSISRLHFWNGKTHDDSISKPTNLDLVPKISYSIQITQGAPSNTASLIALFEAVMGVKPEQAVGFDKSATIYSPYGYRISVQKLNSTSLKPPYAVAITATPAGSKSVTPEEKDAPGKASRQTTPKNDCTDIDSGSSCSFSQTISISDYEHWDVGVNVVGYGPLQRTYTLSSSNIVGVSKSRHMPLYATFDFSPWASRCPMSKWPCVYFQGGIPLSGAVLHLPFVGMALPIPTSKFLQLSIYGGIAFMKQTSLAGLPVGSTATQVQFSAAQRTDWAKKPLYGVEVPVSGIVSKIKSSVGGGSAGSSKK